MKNVKKIKAKRNLKIQGQKGITLLVLVVTIIVLLILAGITIGALTGENGIIKNTKESKEQTEIANEKEILEKATVEAMGKNKYGNIEESELQNALNNETGDGKTEAVDVGEEFEVLFKESNRYYTVDKDGNVGEMQEYVEDKYPGDITVGENGEKLDGDTEKTAYQICCIEDLVAFSNMVNGEGVILENGQATKINTPNTFYGKYVVLKTDLNFKSKLSYMDSERTDFGDINGNDNDGNTLMNEMITGTGFKPIGDYTTTKNNSSFYGIFNGNEKKIKNIYINNNGYAGLFGRNVINNGGSNMIKNIEVTGDIKGKIAGGIIASTYSYTSENSCQVINCINRANIIGDEIAGGIIGEKTSSDGNFIIADCVNFAEISSDTVATGGIIGLAYSNTKIYNCYNIGKIFRQNTQENGYTGLGGIVGVAMYGNNIINSYNLGDVENKGSVGNTGGIVGYKGWAETYLENCYNTGNLSGRVVGGIIGSCNISNELLITQNCFYLNNDISKGIGSGLKEDSEDIKGVSENEIKSVGILELLNNYVEKNSLKDNINLKKWKLEDNGYPTFE